MILDYLANALNSLLRRNGARRPVSGLGLGRVKTQAAAAPCNGVLKRQMFFPSRARLASWRPVTQRRRNLENSAVPTLLARGSRLAIRATMCRAQGDLEAGWNRILTIFDPYTFSHTQGQGLPFVGTSGRVQTASAVPSIPVTG